MIDDRTAKHLAEIEDARRRSLWTLRISDPSGAQLVNVYRTSRRELEELLIATAFNNPMRAGYGEFLRVELEPWIDPTQRRR